MDPKQIGSLVCYGRGKNDKSDCCALSMQPIIRRRRSSQDDTAGVIEPSSLDAAGLPSDQCTREFSARCNRKYHSGTKNTPPPVDMAVYKGLRQHVDFNNREVVTALPGVKPPLTVSALQGKIREQYARVHGATSATLTGTNTVFKPLGINTNAPKSEREANRLRSMGHCRIFFDTLDNDSTQSVVEVPDSRAICADTTHESGVVSNTVVDPLPLEPVPKELTIIGGTRTVYSRDARWQVVTMHMVSIDPSMTDREIENIAREADMQVVTLNLDRNIISHLCNGTGTITCRHTGGEAGLLRFTNLLAQRGIQLYVTDLISKPDTKVTS
ncbi:hypothetical protein BBOV_III003990 [Babesia bovis T2Bo]|uniref:Uncharacterized protein n=1 Tax=Babesia bovis TaxID=5865 RepID=A7AN28_BABBO|nr:hypothetical protein BBOV_III003990 [Babesia bovis T2Bo]EDO07962.1 hypothetical protein BBOV_III003990 [Babesia bovis T2Bo]BAN64400.1 hypothetical protein [Babesia bovis]|eukprot:XP_001611530.1 hypothetical protein [Babesia bovis T2Bo]